MHSVIFLLGKLVYAVNGPTSPLLPIQGLTIDPQTESVIDHWAPEEVINLHMLLTSYREEYLLIFKLYMIVVPR